MKRLCMSISGDEELKAVPRLREKIPLQHLLRCNAGLLLRVAFSESLISCLLVSSSKRCLTDTVHADQLCCKASTTPKRFGVPLHLMCEAASRVDVEQQNPDSPWHTTKPI